MAHSKAQNLPRASFLCLQQFFISDPLIKCSLGKLCVLSIVSSDFSVFLCVFRYIISMPCNCYTSLCICCLLDASTCGLRNYVCSSSSVFTMPLSPSINVYIAVILYSLNWISLHVLSSHCGFMKLFYWIFILFFTWGFTGKDCALKIQKCI